MMKAARNSEMSVNFHQTTLYNNLENSHPKIKTKHSGLNRQVKWSSVSPAAAAAAAVVVLSGTTALTGASRRYYSSIA
jgi:hypothetical protein